MNKRKTKHHPSNREPSQFPTSFCNILRYSPPPTPPCLVRGLSKLLNPSVGKVKVILKICSPITSGQTENGKSFLMIDPRKKQVTVYDPGACGYVASANRRGSITPPKMFAFDAVYSIDDSLTEVCAGSLSDILLSVLEGSDGCLFSYGHSKLGKSYTMIGSDHSPQTLGMIPCAISWLFKLISDQKESTGDRFSVRVSAVEISTQEVLKDLLADFDGGVECGVYLHEDPICGTQLENQSELRAPTAERAAFYFDAALAATGKDVVGGERTSHLLYTLHVYQYRIEKTDRSVLPAVTGGRSRLHLIDLGSTAKSKDPHISSLSLSALGNIIMALLNGQRHLPNSRDSKIAQLLKECLGSATCRICIIVHVSSALHHHRETLQVIQLAARMHRMKRRKNKISCNISEESFHAGSRKFCKPHLGVRLGILRENVFYSSSHSDPDNYTSSSEQSCDTAIYLGTREHSLSDRDMTDNESPPRSVPRTNPRLPRRLGGSRSSGDESSASDSSQSRIYFEHEKYIPVPELKPYNDAQNNMLTSTKGHVQKSKIAEYAYNAEYNKKQQNSLIRKQKYFKHIKPITGEQWIDGPGIVADFSKANERWIDGPQIRKMNSGYLERDMCTNKVKKQSSNERWIDGPSVVVTRDAWANGHNSKQAVVRHIPDIKVRPDSVISVSSITSTHAEASMSRPSSISDDIDLGDSVVNDNFESRLFIGSLDEKCTLLKEAQSFVSVPKYQESVVKINDLTNDSNEKKKDIFVNQDNVLFMQETGASKHVNECVCSYVTKTTANGLSVIVADAETNTEHDFDFPINPNYANYKNDISECNSKVSSSRCDCDQPCSGDPIYRIETNNKSESMHPIEHKSVSKKCYNNQKSNFMEKNVFVDLSDNENRENLDSNTVFRPQHILSLKETTLEKDFSDSLNVSGEILGNVPKRHMRVKSIESFTPPGQIKKSKMGTTENFVQYKMKSKPQMAHIDNVTKPYSKKFNNSLNIQVSQQGSFINKEAQGISHKRNAVISKNQFHMRGSKNKKVLATVNGQLIENVANLACEQAIQKNLLSPYAKITQPKTSSLSSSGHGSENSSLVSNEQNVCKFDKLHGGASSGYESMLRESEASGTSECDDSFLKRKWGSKHTDTRSSRSTPVRLSDSSSDIQNTPISTAYVYKSTRDPIEIKTYTTSDIDRLQRNRSSDERHKLDQHQEPAISMLTKQDSFKQDFVTVTDNIMNQQPGWSFGCKLLMCFSCKSHQQPTDL